MTLRYSTLTACLVIWLAWLPSLTVNAETQDSNKEALQQAIGSSQ